MRTGEGMEIAGRYRLWRVAARAAQSSRFLVQSVTSWDAANEAASADPHAPAPRIAMRTALDAEDVREADVALLAIAVAHLHPAVGGRLEDLEEHLLVRLEHERRLGVGRRTHVGEGHRHHHSLAIAERLVLHPGDLAVHVAHLGPLVQLHQDLEGVVAARDEEAVGFRRRR